jgi:glycosyltransferase involved in cell wall biosynthesis
MLDQITPLILTYNEAPNIVRSLQRLSWARDVVVVDSFSTDATIQLAEQFPNVRVFQRPFDTHAQQWNFGLEETEIKTPWVLALDADYMLTDEFIEEIDCLDPTSGVSGFTARFIYCLQGKPLRSGIYPPVTVLYRHDCSRYEQDGHTQRVRVEGEIQNLRSRILHDDRKPLHHWLKAQARYAELEAQKLSSVRPEHLRPADRMRRWIVVAPPTMLLYCLIVRGGLLDGWAGLHYAFERTIAETMLSLFLINRKIGGSSRTKTSKSEQLKSQALEAPASLETRSSKF